MDVQTSLNDEAEMEISWLRNSYCSFYANAEWSQ